MKKSKRLFYVLMFPAIALYSCGGNSETTDESVYVNVVEAVNADQLGTQTFTGKTKTAEEANVSFRVSGPISRVYVKEGDMVTRGQVIAEMDNRDYQIQFNATKAEYEDIKATAERVIALYKEGNTSAQAYDKARYGLEQITQKFAHHKDQLEDTKLKSPITGYIKEKIHEAGETVAAGMPVFTVAGGSGLEVEINMSANDYGRRDKFTSFSCEFDVMEGETFPLEVVRISNEANTSQLYTVRLRMKGNYDKKKITAGMSTIVKATLEDEDHGVVNVPTSAVLNKDGKTIIYMYDDGVARAKDVTVLQLNRDGSSNVKGIKKGSKVVATGVRNIVDGQKVKPIKPASKSNVGGLL
ncbi:MAG: efflux RND transporter periplasmic adaptor subunit [Bacteroidaceae bacterium]|nr:efflux RND transporter periplasmic adaptor subunit [Bacteroidaceae bacterium]MBR6198044.1 efflux RND transporter periplasmic adaptor subunit [Bacteroidaceae bacterium]